MNSKQTLIYDGDCGFCIYWVEQLKKLVASKLECKPYQTVLSSGTWNGFTREDCKRSIKLYEPNSGKAYEAAHAAFRALSYHEAPIAKLSLWLYEKMPGFKYISEFIYALVALMRPLLSKLGSQICNQNSIDIFIRGIGFCYLLSFASLLPQIEALFGPRGIMPIAWTAIGYNWISSDRAVPVLISICLLGILSGTAIIFRRWTSLNLVIVFILYHFLVSFGEPFMSFQWDALLLETGFLTMLLSFFQKQRYDLAANICYGLLLIVLFKLMFLSGIVKLASSDSSWTSLTALNYHYQTQPIPNLISYFMHQLPAAFNWLSCLIMFGIELILPFFIFLGGDLRSDSKLSRIRAYLRHSAALGLIILQFIIISTGNYCFFNILTILLSTLLIDSPAWERLSKVNGLLRPANAVLAITNRSKAIHQSCNMSRGKNLKLSTLIFTPVLIVIASLLLYINLIFINRPVTSLFKVPLIFDIKNNSPLLTPLNLIFRNHLASPYGLFAVMTKERREIIIQGSNDAQKWLDYEFRYKPGSLYRMPPQVAPHQPRLDWQMWFAALSPWQQNIWFVNLCMRLLEGEASVSRLLAYNPYAAQPPKYIRAISYRYEFTDLNELASTGAYWKRSEPRLYLPIISLRH